MTTVAPAAPVTALPAATAPAGLGWRDRLVDPTPTDRFGGWVPTVVVGLLAAVLRLWRLGSYVPRAAGGVFTSPDTGCSGGVNYSQDIFDEKYYHHDALSLLHHGVELSCDNRAAGFVVHPPLGKWLIALGLQVYGDTPLGWRVSAAVAGTLVVIVVTRLGRRLLGSTALGVVAGLLVCIDGLELVLSRVALLDIFLLLFLTTALATLVADRDWARRRVAGRLDAAGVPVPAAAGTGAGAVNAAAAVLRFPGPRLGLRPWRIATGLLLGCAIAVKWSALYTVPAYAGLAVAWDVGLRRSLGVPRPVRAALRRDVLGAAGDFVVWPVLTYTASWAGWFAAGDRYAYDRAYAHRSGVVGSVANWLQYQCEAYNFHKNLTDQPHYGGGWVIPGVFCRDAHTFHATANHHPYESKPLSWLVLAKPVAFAYTAPAKGQDGCHVTGGCRAEVLAVGNPVIWWAALAALVVLAGVWLARRDWRAALLLVVVAADFLPWLANETRVMFLFYALPLVPLYALALAYVAGLLLGPPGAPPRRRQLGAAAVGGYLALAVGMSVFLAPIWFNIPLGSGGWSDRLLNFPGWI